MKIRLYPSRRILLACVLLLALTAIPTVPTWRAWKHQQLNNALLEAVRGNDTETALRLLQEGGNASMKVVSSSASQRPPHSLAAWVMSKWDQWRHPQPVFEDAPLLPLAVENNNPRLVNVLLQHGANPNTDIDVGIDEPLITRAVETHNVEIVRMLLNAGASVDAEDDGPRDTPLMAACGAGNLEIARLLLSRGADCSHFNRYAGTPLRGAISANAPAIVELLIAHKVDVNFRYADHNNPLQDAEDIDDPLIRRKIRQLLLRAGAKK